MPSSAFRAMTTALSGLLACLLLSACGSFGSLGQDRRNKMIVSVRDQKMVLLTDGKPIKSYKISTSKFGLGDKPGSYQTPTGHLRIAKKIGCDAPHGAVFKSRKRTGEVIRPNAPGRDPIVTRILWLKGIESQNRNAFRRMIYIHGTPEERNLGRPVSYGCIRMSSRDVVDLYNRVGAGADLFVVRGPVRSLETRRTLAAAFGNGKPRS